MGGLDWCRANDPVPRLAAIDGLRVIAVIAWLACELGRSVLIAMPQSLFTVIAAEQLSPSIWHGMTMADLVLPTFLFALGAGTSQFVTRARERGATNGRVGQRAAIRFCVFFALGLVCGGCFGRAWRDVQFVGPFQRIAICSLLATAIVWSTRWPLQLATMVTCLIGYWIALFCIPLPWNPQSHVAIESNLASSIDRLIIPGRLYCGSWDPNGIITTIPAFAVVLWGVLAGTYLSQDGSAETTKGAWLLVIGAIVANLGYLCDLAIPSNSYLLTPSFVLTAVGIGTALLGLLQLVHAVTFGQWLLNWITVVGRHSLIAILAAATAIRILYIVSAAIAAKNVRTSFTPRSPLIMAILSALIVGFIIVIERRKIRLRL
jgi:predicted acyltransferase